MRGSQMVIEFVGGPVDGATIEGNGFSPYMVVTSHRESPVYRSGCCNSCASARAVTPYYFLGYQESICFEYPKHQEMIDSASRSSLPE